MFGKLFSALQWSSIDMVQILNHFFFFLSNGTCKTKSSESDGRSDFTDSLYCSNFPIALIALISLSVLIALIDLIVKLALIALTALISLKALLPWLP